MIEWDLPGPNTPGFLRRRKELGELLDAEYNPTNLEAVNEYLLQFIKQPEGRDEALEAILDLSGAEYSRVILKLLGEIPHIPDPKGGPSGQL
ncbi:MAG TPA: hypothetical protein VJK02_08280 [Anaerolineales bacterium]|nr:hypothetical protein [Anaerolineales bacterium]